MSYSIFNPVSQVASVSLHALCSSQLLQTKRDLYVRSSLFREKESYFSADYYLCYRFEERANFVTFNYKKSDESMLHSFAKKWNRREIEAIWNSIDGCVTHMIYILSLKFGKSRLKFLLQWMLSQRNILPWCTLSWELQSIGWLNRIKGNTQQIIMIWSFTKSYKLNLEFGFLFNVK